MKKLIETVKEYKEIKNELNKDKDEYVFSPSFLEKVYLHNCKCSHASTGIITTLLYTALVVNDSRISNYVHEYESFAGVFDR